MIKNIGINAIPHIFVDRVNNSGKLVLKHEHDGRDLDLSYANKVVEHIEAIWGNKGVKLYTIVEEEIWEV